MLSIRRAMNPDPGLGPNSLLDVMKWPKRCIFITATIKNAFTVFVGLQQGEAAYYQDTGNTLLSPAP